MSDRIAKLETIKAALQAAAPTKLVTRSFEDLRESDSDDLTQGIFSIVSASEDGFRSFPHQRVCEGKQELIIVGQQLLNETATGEDVENAEFSMINDIETMLTKHLTADIQFLKLKKYEQSRQVECPFAWVVCFLELDNL